MNDVVVLVPGLGLGGIELSFLARRLNRRGFRTRVFWHFAWRGDLAAKALALHRFVAGIEANQVHFVCHSMGGNIVLYFLAHHEQTRPGRVVVLGTPINGSAAAERLAKLPLGIRVLGHCMNQARLETFNMPTRHQIGGVAGTMPIGAGRFLGVQSPSDGVVRVDEATHRDMSDSQSLPVSHMGLVLSRRVVELIVRFLEYGSFKEAVLKDDSPGARVSGTGSA
jgi:hypothetical protein